MSEDTLTLGDDPEFVTDTDPTDDRRRVLDRLRGRTCPVTDDCDGDLVREAYKETDALVCVECGTPAVRFW